MMPKIRVEIDIPNDKYCTGCDYFKYLAYDLGVCSLFGKLIQLHTSDRRPERCIECKQAEVEE